MICTKCKVDQPETNFYKDRSKPSGIHSNCKTCQSSRVKTKRTNDHVWRKKQIEKSKQYREKNPEQTKLSIKNWTYKTKYGITYHQFLSKINEQDGLCKICSTKLEVEGRNCSQKAVVDHCHSTGKIRGIICHRCNVGLGNFLDNAQLLNKAQEYISSESFF